MLLEFIFIIWRIAKDLHTTRIKELVMTPHESSKAKQDITNWMDLVHGPCEGKDLRRENLLPDAWKHISNMVHWNRENPLVAESVRAYPDFIPRAFTLLTILYGSYGAHSGERTLQKDLIGLLGDDLDERELQIFSYAQSVWKQRAVYPELYTLFTKIRDVYGAEHFSLAVLPPTPHQAYALFVLNHPELITRNISHEELFGHLAIADSQMRKIFSLTDVGQKSGIAKNDRH